MNAIEVGDYNQKSPEEMIDKEFWAWSDDQIAMFEARFKSTDWGELQRLCDMQAQDRGKR